MNSRNKYGVIRTSKDYRWMPFRIIRAYVVVTLILSLFGPANYGYDVFFGMLTVIYIFLFLLISQFGMSRAYHYEPAWRDNTKLRNQFAAAIEIMTYITLVVKIMLVVSSVRIYGIPIISLNSLFSSLASSYTELHHGEYYENVYRQIDTFMTFVFYISTFGGLYWRKRLKRSTVFIIAINIVLQYIYNILYIGTMRSLSTIIIFALSLVMTEAVKNNVSIDKKKLRRALIIGVVLILFIINGLSARETLWHRGANYWDSNKYDLNNVFLLLFRNDKTKYDIARFMDYFTQGYYGLSLTFQVPMRWTYMLGSVRGLTSIITQFLPFIPDPIDNTYPMRAAAQFGRNGLGNWFTIFPWLASDITFIGALVYMGIVAYIYMKCWIQSVKNDNPLSFVIFVILNIQYIFLVANNQLFVARGESLGTVILFILYFIYNKRLNTTEQTSYDD